jgi:putative membrane protein
MAPFSTLSALAFPGFVFPTGVLPSAAVAYVHYLSFMVCFGALVLERRLIKANPAKGEATLMVITDVVYGIAALAVLLSGILRVLHYGQGSGFYTANPLFWWKVGVYLAVGTLSLYPTVLHPLGDSPAQGGAAPGERCPGGPVALGVEHRAGRLRHHSPAGHLDGARRWPARLSWAPGWRRWHWPCRSWQ